MMSLYDDGDTMMKLEETEAEIDAWLSIQTEIAEEQFKNAGKMLECEHMELEEETCGIDCSFFPDFFFTPNLIFF